MCGNNTAGVNQMRKRRVIKTGIIRNYRKMVIFWNNFQRVMLTFGAKMKIRGLRCSDWARQAK